jgi:transcriptional regulator with XRE-family HTH domain
MISSPDATSLSLSTTIAETIHRLMAREGLTYDELGAVTGLDQRTIRGLMRGTNRPHARTLHKLANGLGVAVDELFSNSSGNSQTEFDRACNPALNDVVAAHPEVFDGWTSAEFAELASRFGTGGQLTEPGTVAAARAMNDKRAVMNQVAVILETHQRDVLTEFVEFLYRRVTVEQ